MVDSLDPAEACHLYGQTRHGVGWISKKDTHTVIKITKTVLQDVLANPPVQPSDADKHWLDSMLKRGDKERFSIDVNYTPGMAMLMLQRLNRRNRRIILKNLRTHISRLKSGRFILTHQGVAVNTDHELNDRQHRFLGIILTGIPGEIQTTFGAKPVEKTAIDQGARRTTDDMLQMSGKNHTKVRAAAARVCLQLAEGRNPEPDAQMVFHFEQCMETNPDWEEALSLATPMSKVCSTVVPVLVAAFHIRREIASKKRKDKMHDFFHNLASGEKLSGVKLKLRERLKDQRGVAGHSAADSSVILAGRIVQAYNQFVRGRKSLPWNWKEVSKLPGVDM